MCMNGWIWVKTALIWGHNGRTVIADSWFGSVKSSTALMRACRSVFNHAGKDSTPELSEGATEWERTRARGMDSLCRETWWRWPPGCLLHVKEEAIYFNLLYFNRWKSQENEASRWDTQTAGSGGIIEVLFFNRRVQSLQNRCFRIRRCCQNTLTAYTPGMWYSWIHFYQFFLGV